MQVNDHWLTSERWGGGGDESAAKAWVGCRECLDQGACCPSAMLDTCFEQESMPSSHFCPERYCCEVSCQDELVQNLK